MFKQTEKQKKALAQSQAIMKLTPKYRAQGMSLKEAWVKAKKEYFSDRKTKNPLPKTVCYKRGVNPKSRKTARRKNPTDSIPSMVEIYSQALETHAMKGSNSLFPGQEFVHEWEKAGTKIFGLPAGTIISLPDGDSVTLDKRTVIMLNKKEDLWDLFRQ